MEPWHDQVVLSMWNKCSTVASMGGDAQELLKWNTGTGEWHVQGDGTVLDHLEGATFSTVATQVSKTTRIKFEGHCEVTSNGGDAQQDGLQRSCHWDDAGRAQAPGCC